MYDVELLLDEADSLSVANYLGMDIVKRGSRYFIPCPGHEQRLGKPDRKTSNCVLTPKGYHCFACQERVGLINMVMEYTGCEYREALTIIGDACGGAELFETNGKQIKKPPLSHNDLAIIGLKAYAGKNIFGTVNINGDKNVTEKKEGLSLEMLFVQDEKSYNKLIYRKAKEAVAKYEEALKNFCFRDAPKANVIFDLLNEDGYLPPDCFSLLQKTFQARLWRAQEICEDFKNRQ